MIVTTTVAVCDGCAAYGNAAVETGIGGSIPFIAEFARTFPAAELTDAEKSSRFDSLRAALWAAEQAGWVRRLSGRLLCPACADRQNCRSFGHSYEPDSWRVCACDRSLPAHDGHEPWQDPNSWEGCGWSWRLCGRCDHIDERHITAGPGGMPSCAEREYDAALDRGEYMKVQPGDGFLAEVAAGLGLPNHQQVNGENAMVEPSKARPAATVERPGGEVR